MQFATRCTCSHALQGHRTTNIGSPQAGLACMGSNRRCRVGHHAPTCSANTWWTKVSAACLLRLPVLLPTRPKFGLCPCLVPACMGWHACRSDFSSTAFVRQVYIMKGCVMNHVHICPRRWRRPAPSGRYVCFFEVCIIRAARLQAIRHEI